MTTGLWMTPTTAHRWWFDSGALSLDLAHTGGLDAPETREQLHSPTDLQAWLGERFERLAEDAAARDLADTIGLREAVLRLARASARGDVGNPDDIDAVNLFAATPDVPPALDGGRRQAGRTRVRTGQALSAIARDAVTLFAGDTEGRIRECAADDCGLIFYDESRTNNRRWCSMQQCGNRAKIRAFRARQSP